MIAYARLSAYQRCGGSGEATIVSTPSGPQRQNLLECLLNFLR